MGEVPRQTVRTIASSLVAEYEERAFPPEAA